MANNVISGMHFHHVALSVSDFDASIKFYTDGLGFTLYRQWVSGEGKKIALIDMGNGSYFEVFSDGEIGEAPVKAGCYFHLALGVDDPYAAYDRALSCGAQPHKEPCHMALPSEPPIPVDLAFVKGPDGELIEFFCPNKG